MPAQTHHFCIDLATYVVPGMTFVNYFSIRDFKYRKDTRKSCVYTKPTFCEGLFILQLSIFWCVLSDWRSRFLFFFGCWFLFDSRVDNPFHAWIWFFPFTTLIEWIVWSWCRSKILFFQSSCSFNPVIKHLQDEKNECVSAILKTDFSSEWLLPGKTQWQGHLCEKYTCAGRRRSITYHIIEEKVLFVNTTDID